LFTALILNYETTKVGLQVDMTFISLEYSLEESNICSKCMIPDGHQSCTVDIPSDFAGSATLATSANDKTDQQEVWKDTVTLPVSWECS
jgi:hypothetical protein